MTLAARSPLARPVKPRRVPPRAAQHDEAHYTYAVLGRTCWLRQFDDRHCEGRMDPAHLIPKQTLKKARVEVDIWDERLWIPACRFHHGQWDNYRLTVPRESLPAGFVAVCGELGLDWYLDRRFPAAEAAA